MQGAQNDLRPHCSTNEISGHKSQIQLFPVRTPTVTQMSIFIECIPSVTGAGVSWHCVGTVLMTPTDSLSTFINVCEYNAHTSCNCLATLYQCEYCLHLPIP